MYQTIKYLENLSFSTAMKKLTRVAKELNMTQIAPFLYLSKDLRIEMIADNGTYIILFQKYIQVKQESVAKLVRNFEMKKIAREVYVMETVTVKGN